VRLFAIHEPLLVPITDRLHDDSQLLAKTFSATLLQNKVQQEEPAGLPRTMSFWLFASRSTTHLKLMSLGQAGAETLPMCISLRTDCPKHRRNGA
jgi:hypothetical protein